MVLAIPLQRGHHEFLKLSVDGQKKPGFWDPEISERAVTQTADGT